MAAAQRTTTLAGSSTVSGTADGKLDGAGHHGWINGDLRVLSVLEWDVAGGRFVGVERQSAARVIYRSVVTEPGGNWVDAVVLVSQVRVVHPDSLEETVLLVNHGDEVRSIEVRLRLACDFTPVDRIRAGTVSPDALAEVHAAAGSTHVQWRRGDAWARTAVSPEATSVTTLRGVLELCWRIELQPGDERTVALRAHGGTTAPAAFPALIARNRPRWTIEDPVAAAALDDLDALLLADPAAPHDTYAAAGSPWYLTLFGRDSLWTASMLLPLDTGLAGGTLRALARRQGVEHDPATEEAPGKIPHEARTRAIDTGQVRLPELYYGTIDATALWIRLLHDAWRAGMPEHEVKALMPTLAAAMRWLTGLDADPDDDGLIEYAGSANGGLANQGWKDSHDGIRHADRGVPAGPLALCEVQGYSYAAARSATELAAAFGIDSTGWSEWAARLRARFHESFWLSDQHGDYVAVALDGEKEPIDGATSNMGHLLGTGILDRHQAQLVANRLQRNDLLTPYGLRTLASTSRAFNPLSYHLGSVWPHDTAIVMIGAAQEGLVDFADDLAHAVLRAASHYGGRVPELFGVVGESLLDYPAACSPQAWSAAGVVRAHWWLSKRTEPPA